MTIPDKNYFTIREASKITGVKPYQLRYWEEKFKIIKPIRLTTLHRRYTRKDIENILKIKELLIRGYSINGIKRLIYNRGKNISQTAPDKPIKLLKAVNEEIKNIINELSG